MNNPSIHKLKRSLVDVMEVLDNLVEVAKKLEVEGVVHALEDGADMIAHAHEHVVQHIRRENQEGRTSF